MTAMISFREMVLKIGEDDARLGKVQPVYLRDVDTDKVNVAYRRSGAGAAGGIDGPHYHLQGPRPDGVVVEWTTVAPKWQDAEDVNEKIVKALFDNPAALNHPEAYVSGMVDDVIELGGQDDALYVVQQSALLVDGNW